MALTESDLSELPGGVKAGEFDERIRTSLEWVLQQLIEAEASAVIGAGRYERSEDRLAERNGHRPRLRPRPRATSSWRSPSCARGPSSRASSSGGGASIGLSMPWSWRPMCTGSRRGRSTTWSRPWVLRLGSPSRRRAASVPASTRSWPIPLPTSRPRRLPRRLRRRHLREGPRARPGGSRAVVVATGVTAHGDREVLGIEVGDSEDGAFWTAFFKGTGPGDSAVSSS